jgi:hypothetical protein
VASQVYLVSSGRKEEKGKRMYLKNFLNKSLTIDYKCRTVAKQFGIYGFGDFKRLDCHYLSEQLAFFSLP